jgi:hypothetical protein
MWAVPQPKDALVEGQTADLPIILAGTTALDFERLLAVFYPKCVFQYLSGTIQRKNEMKIKMENLDLKQEAERTRSQDY